MKQASMAAYLQSRIETKTRGLNQDIARTLIYKHPSLLLNHHGVKAAKFSLAVLVNALLEVSHENGFIKYDAFHETIQIKTFDNSYLIYQYNPFRDPANRHAEGQTVKKPDGHKTDFLAWETFPKNEHYLIWKASSGKKYGILVQPAPIVPGHLIISSLDKNKDTGEHYPQIMTLMLLKDMHEFQLSLSEIGYAMGYNAWGAGASVDHFHVQAVTAMYLPVISAIDQGKLPFVYQGHDNHDVTLDIINNQSTDKAKFNYPANGLLLRSNYYELLYERKKQILDYLNRHNYRFNLISWKQPSGQAVDLFLPREQEAIMNQAFNAGYVEMAGMLIMPKKSLFESIVEPETGESALKEASIKSDDFSQIIEFVKTLFPQVN